MDTTKGTVNLNEVVYAKPLGESKLAESSKPKDQTESKTPNDHPTDPK